MAPLTPQQMRIGQVTQICVVLVFERMWVDGYMHVRVHGFMDNSVSRTGRVEETNLRLLVFARIDLGFRKSGGRPFVP